MVERQPEPKPITQSDWKTFLSQFESANSKAVSIELSTHDWRMVLNHLDFCMGFRNVDVTIAIDLYEKIAFQLTGVHVTIISPPDESDTKEQEKPSTGPTGVPKKIMMFLRDFLGWK